MNRRGLLELVAKRLAWGVLILWVVVTLTFVASLFSPVDAVVVYAGRFATPQVREEIRKEFGLDRPFPVRYADYVKGLLEGKLG